MEIYEVVLGDEHVDAIYTRILKSRKEGIPIVWIATLPFTVKELVRRHTNERSRSAYFRLDTFENACNQTRPDFCHMEIDMFFVVDSNTYFAEPNQVQHAQDTLVKALELMGMQHAPTRAMAIFVHMDDNGLVPVISPVDEQTVISAFQNFYSAQEVKFQAGLQYNQVLEKLTLLCGAAVDKDPACANGEVTVTDETFMYSYDIAKSRIDRKPLMGRSTSGK